jgi:thioredoxin reductase (NADPH)
MAILVMMYDSIIVGAGPAGSTAALFLQRYGAKTLMLADPMSLAQSEEASSVDDWPGTRNVSGFDLTDKFREHAKSYGAEFRMEKVIAVKKDGPTFSVKTEEGTYQARCVILATGAKHRKGLIKGEEQFSGKGVGYCASCDGPLYKGRKVLVIGGGDTAVNSGILLANMGANVTLIHRRDELRASKANQDRLMKTGAKIIWDSVVLEITGEKMASKAIIMNVKTKEKREMAADGIFISIGSVPTSELAKGLGVKLNESGYIITDLEQGTNVEGVFAAGDCTVRNAKKIVVAAGYGAVAATSAYNWLKDQQA